MRKIFYVACFVCFYSLFVLAGIEDGRVEQKERTRIADAPGTALLLTELTVDQEFACVTNATYSPATGYVQWVSIAPGKIRCVASGRPLPKRFAITLSAQQKRLESEGAVLDFQRFSGFPVEVL